MRKSFAIVLTIIIILLSNAIYAKECQTPLKPKINLSGNEELFEDTPVYRQIVDSGLPFVEYIEINSSFQDFVFDEENGYLNFTPISIDLGEHDIMFFAIDTLGCYSAKLVSFYVYDKPRIIQLKPDSKYYAMYEGQSSLFSIDVDDKDNDINEYEWRINGIIQMGNLKETFVFSPGYNSTGEYNISVIVIDSKKLNDSYEWQITVREKNRDPYLFSEIPDFAFPKGFKASINSLNSYFGDPDNDMLSFSTIATDEYGQKLGINTTIDSQGNLIINYGNFSGVLILEIIATDPYGAVVKSNKFKVFIIDKNDGSKKKTNYTCGDLICTSDESCDLCEKDCGPCTDKKERCLNDWNCSQWTECLSTGYSARMCTDNNKCYDDSNKPVGIVNCKFLGSCFDKILNGNERKVDCGGSCGPCPTCFDRVSNQGEKGIDCGGPCDALCPTCDDKIQNQFESDIDCGGPCIECDSALKCYSWKDCKSHVCREGVCSEPTCFDSVKNGDEKGVDCEGSCGTPCPTCSDRKQNQGEKGVDCGGPCIECATCADKIINQGEIYADCGGPCRRCGWTDFKNNNPSKAILIEVIILLFLLPFISLIVYEIGRVLFGKNKVEKFILLNSVFHRLGRKKGSLIDKKELIYETSLNLKKLQKDISESGKKNIKEDITEMMSEFLENLADIKLPNDEKTMLLKMEEKKIVYPLNRIILFIAIETKEISTKKYLSGLETISRVEELNKAMSALEKET